MKKIISVILVFVLSFGLLVSFASCGEDTNSTNEFETLEAHEASSRFIKIKHQDLYYDVETNIVYVIFKETPLASYSGYGYMSIYLGSNGYPCKYDVDAEQIVELNYSPNNEGLQ